jgi:hypothetical protein
MLDAIAPARSRLDDLAQQPILLGCDTVHVDADLLLAARRERRDPSRSSRQRTCAREASIAERAGSPRRSIAATELADLTLELVRHAFDQKRAA